MIAGRWNLNRQNRKSDRVNLIQVARVHATCNHLLLLSISNHLNIITIGKDCGKTAWVTGGEILARQVNGATEPGNGGKNSPLSWTSAAYSQNRVADYKPYNFVDGEGVRCSLYVSGCLFACPGCYNASIQDFSAGFPYTRELEQKILADLAAPYCQGLTLLGGEPFLNTGVCLSLVRAVRQRFGHTKDIWAWSGYTWEELQAAQGDKWVLLQEVDVLVDGRFILSQKNLQLQFRGSENQRIIDVPASIAAGRPVLWARMQTDN